MSETAQEMNLEQAATRYGPHHRAALEYYSLIAEYTTYRDKARALQAELDSRKRQDTNHLSMSKLLQSLAVSVTVGACDAAISYFITKSIEVTIVTFGLISAATLLTMWFLAKRGFTKA